MKRTAASEELVRGAVLILFGVAVLTVPAGFLTVVLRIFGLVALIDGGLAFVGLFRGRASAERSKWRLAFEGAVGVVAGCLTLVWPSITAFALLTILGVWTFLTGGAELMSAIGGDSSGGRRAFGLLRGGLGLAFGLLLLAHPVTTSGTLVAAIGIYAMATGVTMIASGLAARRLSV